MDFHGLAIGGLAVGEPQAVMLDMIETVMPHLTDAKPHYLMGVGTPDDLLEAIARGVDMFDCVMPPATGGTARPSRASARSICAMPDMPKTCARWTRNHPARPPPLFAGLYPPSDPG